MVSSKLRELIAKWRKSESSQSFRDSSYSEGAKDQAGVCADELEAALAESGAGQAQFTVSDLFRIEIDPTTPQNEIHFRDSAGNTYKFTNVKVPAQPAAGRAASGAQPSDLLLSKLYGEISWNADEPSYELIDKDDTLAAWRHLLAAPPGHAELLGLLKGYKEHHEFEHGCDAEPCEKCQRVNALLRASQAGSQ